MRFAFFLVLLPSLVYAHDVEFTRIWPTWRDTASFVRISEYFGGKEDTGRQTMLRTHPESRDGFYFLARVNNPGATCATVRFALEVITPDAPLPKVFVFPTALPSGSHAFNLGLTGADWVGENVHPVAWRLRLIDADDQEIASSQSFLWRMPDETKH